MKYFYKKLVVLLLFSMLYTKGYGQHMERDVISATTIYVKAIYNDDSQNAIEVFIDGSPLGTIRAGGSLTINKKSHKEVRVQNPYRSIILWRMGDTEGEWNKKNTGNTTEEVEKEKKIPVSSSVALQKEEAPYTQRTKARQTFLSKPQIIEAFKENLEKDSFYSSLYLQELSGYVDKQVEMMDYVKDKESRDKYIQEYNLNEFIHEEEAMMKELEAKKETVIANFLNSYVNDIELPDYLDCKNEMNDILTDKVTERKIILEKLRSEISKEEIPEIVVKRLFSGTSITINIVVGILVVVLIVSVAIIINKRNKSRKRLKIREEEIQQAAKTNIVVRRKTTSILKKQSLEDVHHNNAYLQIDCADFCADSAVRRIYFKNTCIKDIYNLYAEDLRNPDNPNEDGCMVLGRWVHDKENDEYYVSLEEIVKPGDDAVFKEYELNFGGKIKLKVSEKLRKLRRETNLQYDMTCWVHSHPGLGVFFSNADSSVQMQLKHPTHPKFLTAIVIDILTPNQELGIFTFKHDMTINSKADLQKMYSLEEMYKWAVESDRTSFKTEDYRNIMQTASKRMNSHFGVELSNGAIIDMCQLQTEQRTGGVAWAHGYACENNEKTEFIVESVSRSKQSPDNDLIGCFINGSHCSIPTIRKIIANDYHNIKFILFYSVSDDILTSIPVVENQVSVEENCYGEEKLENLKIWTRRKR